MGVSSHNLAAVHPVGTPPAEAIVCVKNGTTLTLSGIPQELQTEHGIGASEMVEFVDTGDNRQDLLRFEDGREISLRTFANTGVSVYVGVKPIKLSARPNVRAKRDPVAA